MNRRLALLFCLIALVLGWGCLFEIVTVVAGHGFVAGHHVGVPYSQD
jgi:hypothetical protein